MELKIDNDFKELIPNLSEEEFKQLEKNCISDGIRDSICIWNNTIIDGHNRYNIAKNNNLEFKIKEYIFDNREKVIEWIILNQFGRRNLTNFQRSELALRLKDYYSKLAKENSGIRTDLNQKSDKGYTPVNTLKELSKTAGVSHDTMFKTEKILEKADDKTKEDLRLGNISINEAYMNIKKEDKKEKLREKQEEYNIKINSELKHSIDIYKTDKKFRVIYADPPWKYDDPQNSSNLGGAEKHYKTMTIQEICDLPIKNIIEKDAVLFLWVTSPKLNQCWNIINSWGFEYKTSFVWDKVKHNMGHYNSVRHEFLLICGKGKSTPDINILKDSVITIERSDKHSEKPIEFINIIDELYQFGNRIELFARENKKEKWYYWGNEL